MKIINVLYAILIAAISCVKYFVGFNAEYEYVFLLCIILLFALLAIDSRGLNYLFFNEGQYGRQGLLIFDFIVKIIAIGSSIALFFVTHILLLIITLVCSLMEVILFMLERTWFIGNLVVANPTPRKKNIAIIIKIALSYISYIISVCLVFFPNYTIQLNWIWLICLAAVMVLFIRCALKLNASIKKLLFYIIMYIVSLCWFVLTKYAFEVESPITFFTLIGMAFMLPYFTYISKLLKNMVKEDNEK